MLRSLLALGPQTVHCLLAAATTGYLLVASIWSTPWALSPARSAFPAGWCHCRWHRALIALIHNPAALGQTIYSGLGISACLVTIGIAARQLWLQSLPADQVPACGPSSIT